MSRDAMNTDIRLEAHPSARSQATSTSLISAGSTILSIPPLSTVLLPAEKGRRCDTCHCLPSDTRPLQRCSGCASYWYCGSRCQNLQWRNHHKYICKLYNQYISSNGYQALPLHEKMDALLLSHLVAHMPSSDDPSSPMSIFLSLLPGPASNPQPPLIFPIKTSWQRIQDLYSRFGNNNFAIHSHFTTFGHGIFPLASRLFNHSCVPNAAAKYILTPAQPVTMEVVALRNILPGEEICLPYLDPALFQTRQQSFDITYGFRCNCTSCQFIDQSGPIPPPPKSATELLELSAKLRDFVGLSRPILTLPTQNLDSLPNVLLCVLDESYITTLSETFSKSSHEGLYDLALDAGVTLLALYILIYPPNYPQIGIHLLEMTKTMWNSIVSSVGLKKENEKALIEEARAGLTLAREVFLIIGPEGDESDGPLRETETLQGLLEC